MRRAAWSPGALSALIALTAAAAALRFATLSMQSFWTDEAVTALLARRSFPSLFASLAETERTPPLYYMLAWLWSHVFGSGEAGLRSLSALAGTAAVPLVYLAARELASVRTGLIAAALVATHPLLVWYSQEARAYSLLVLTVAAALLFFARSTKSKGGRSPLLWALASVAALATHYVAVFVVASMALALLLARRDAVSRLAVAITGAGGLALLPLALRQGRRTAWLEETGLGPRGTFAVKQLLVGADAPHDRLAAVVVALAYLTAVLVLVRSRDRPRLRAAVLVGAVAGAGFAIPLVLASLAHDYFVGRNTLAVLVPFVVVVSVALAASRRLGVALTAVVCTVGVALVAAVQSRPAHHRADWRGAAAAAAAGPGERLIVVLPDWGGWFARIPFAVYLPAARSVDADLVDPMRQFQGLLEWEQARAPGTVTVSTVVEVTVGATEFPAVPRLPPAFRRSSAVTSRSGYTVTRHESDRPVALRLATLIPPVPYHADVAYLLLDG